MNSLQKYSILPGKGFLFEGSISIQGNQILDVGCNPSECANDYELMISLILKATMMVFKIFFS